MALAGLPFTGGQVSDWIRIANWAGNDREAAGVQEHYGPDHELDPQALAAAARSLRNLKKWPESLALWEQALKEDPGNTAWQKARIATLADAGRVGEAAAALKALNERGTTPDAELEDYVSRRAGRPGSGAAPADPREPRGQAGAPRDPVAVSPRGDARPDPQPDPDPAPKPDAGSGVRGDSPSGPVARTVAGATADTAADPPDDTEADRAADKAPGGRAGRGGPDSGDRATEAPGAPQARAPGSAAVLSAGGVPVAVRAPASRTAPSRVAPSAPGGSVPAAVPVSASVSAPAAAPGASRVSAPGSARVAPSPPFPQVARAPAPAAVQPSEPAPVGGRGVATGAATGTGTQTGTHPGTAPRAEARDYGAPPQGVGYDDLVRMARDGRHAPVLAWLADAARKGPLPDAKIADWVVIAGWAGDGQTVRDVYGRYRDRPLPAGAHAAAARAFRDAREWTPALAAWQAAMRKAPNDRGLRMGYIYTLADAGQDDRALPMALDMVKKKPDALSYAVLAYVHRSAYHNFGVISRLFDSFEAATKANELDPNIRDVQQIYVGSMQMNRLAAPAFIESGRPPHAIDAASRRQLMSDVAAELVRLPGSSIESERFHTADKALVLYDRMFQQWAGRPEARDLLIAVRQDYIGALHNRMYMKEATDEYEALVAEGVTVNDQVLFWVAGAYLYQKLPEKAVPLYEALASRGPKALGEERYFEANVGLFNALSENNQHYRAREVAEAFRDHYRPFYTPKGSGVEIPNNEWFLAQEVWGASLQSSDYLPEAQAFYETLLQTAPTSQGLRTSLAAVYSARGWPRRAEEELKIAESLEPTNLGVLVQQGRTALELQEWDQFEQIASDVITRYPESLEAQRLDRLRAVHHMAELRVTGYRGLYSDSPSPVTGTNDWGFDTVLYSPPLYDNWRVFGGGGYRRGKFQEGYAYQRTLRAGVEYRTRDNWLELELSHHDYKAGDTFAFRASAWHDFNDHWRVGFTGETLAARTPLRALNSNIEAGGFDTWVRWYDSERREWTLGAAPLWFTDGNFRMDYALAGKERLITDPYFTLDLRPDISFSHNSHTNVPYWSPKMDFGATPGLDARHVLYRRYQTIWSHNLAGGIGPYWQKGHGWDWSAFVTYGHRVEWNDVLDAGAYVTYRNRPYDGVREQEVQGTFDLRYRF
nr:poly-beta-1,6 N-acetyl-D-glucosamine export porin PgaA [Phaeovibrio sulfidiphilus]